MDITSFILGSVAGAKSASGLKYLVVDELPQVGQNNIIYLVPKSTSKTNNYYDEYMWISNAWELIGDTEVDLSNYQEKLVSGTNIKTINNNSILGSGNLDTEIIQYSTMPTASTDTVGKIIQYTGTTDSTYTNGYFYIGTSDSTGGTTTYSWENVEVQAGGGSSAPEYIIDTNGNKLYFVAIKDSSEVNTILKSTAQKVVDDYENNIKSGIFILDTTDYAKTGAYYIKGKSGIQYLFASNINFAMSNKTQSYTNYYVSNMGFGARYSGTTITEIVSYGNPETRKDLYCIETGYNYSQPYTPTYDGSPATKKYVDDTTLLKAYQLAGLSEYSSSSTYAVGDYVYYNNLIYKCSTAVSVAEAFDDTKWTQKTYMQYMSDTLVGTALGGSY